jgi:hypothetical protein
MTRVTNHSPTTHDTLILFERVFNFDNILRFDHECMTLCVCVCVCVCVVYCFCLFIIRGKTRSKENIYNWVSV